MPPDQQACVSAFVNDDMKLIIHSPSMKTERFFFCVFHEQLNVKLCISQFWALGCLLCL